jgi:hypothetical protein
MVLDSDGQPSASASELDYIAPGGLTRIPEGGDPAGPQDLTPQFTPPPPPAPPPDISPVMESLSRMEGLMKQQQEVHERQLNELRLRLDIAQAPPQGQVTPEQVHALASQIPMGQGDQSETTPSWAQVRELVAATYLNATSQAALIAQAEGRKAVLGLTGEDEQRILQAYPEIATKPEPQRSLLVCRAFEPEAKRRKEAAAPSASSPAPNPQRTAPQPVTQHVAPMPAHQPPPAGAPRSDAGNREQRIATLQAEYEKAAQIRNFDERDKARRKIMGELADLTGVTGGFEGFTKQSWEIHTSSVSPTRR